jgi:hypothetical protein
MLLEEILELQVKAFLLRIILIHNVLAILMPLRIDCTHEGLHAYFVQTKFFSKAVDPKTNFD